MLDMSKVLCFLQWFHCLRCIVGDRGKFWGYDSLAGGAQRAVRSKCGPEDGDTARTAQDRYASSERKDLFLNPVRCQL
jgi:hypothetical protein